METDLRDKILTEVAKMAGWPILAATCTLAFLAPIVDEWLLPVRSHQSVSNVTRYRDRVCFTWRSIKLQNRVSDNMDSYLFVGDDRFSVAIYEESTGFPWGKSRAVSLGWHDQRYCTSLPPSVKNSDEVRVTNTAFYPGSFGSVWHVKVRVPDVVSRGSATGESLVNSMLKMARVRRKFTASRTVAST